MPNTLFPTWVKNVYSLGMTQGIKSVSLPTYLYLLLTRPYVTANNSMVFPSFIRSFYTPFSTIKYQILPPLNNQLYPLSTPPITIRTKEN